MDIQILPKIPSDEFVFRVINRIIDNLNYIAKHGGGGGAEGFYIGTKEDRLALTPQNGYEFNQVELDGTVHRYFYEKGEWVLLANPDVHDTEEVIIMLSTNFGEIDFTQLDIEVVNNTTGISHKLDVDSTGEGIIYIPIGDSYTIQCPQVTGYELVPDVTHTAERYVRQINIVYQALKTSTTFYIDETIADPDSRVSYEEGASFGKDGTPGTNAVTWIRANTHAYVGKWNTGTSTMDLKQLSDADFTTYADGTDASNDIRDVNNQGFDVFIKLPEFYYSSKLTSTGVEFSFAKNGQAGYQHWDGNTLIGVYKAWNDSSNRIRSLSDKTPTVNVSQDTFKQRTRSRNSGMSLPINNGYSLIKFVPHSILGFLFYAYYGTTNCQKQCGFGTETYPKTTGRKNSIGMTDTTATDGNSDSIKFWGLENWWGDIYEWMDDIYTIDSQGTCELRNLDGSFVDKISVHPDQFNNWCNITKIACGTKMYLCPNAASGTDYSLHYADGVVVYSASGRVANRSSFAAYPDGGVGCLCVGVAPSYSYAGIGSRLLYYGPCNIV